MDIPDCVNKEMNKIKIRILGTCDRNSWSTISILGIGSEKSYIHFTDTLYNNTKYQTALNMFPCTGVKTHRKVEGYVNFYSVRKHT
jgi:hypothetical protein